MSNELLKQIDELVASKTFNLDALEGIKAIKDNFAKTLTERDLLKNMHKEILEANRELISEKDRLNVRIEELKRDLAESEAYRAKAREAVWEKEVAKATAEAYKDALYTVFKPSAVRETIQRSVAVPVTGNPGGNGSYPSAGTVMQGAEAETITKEQL